MLVFKILTPSQMAALVSDGVFAGAPVDLSDGYVHLSAAHQVRETAAKHFADQPTLWLIACEADALGEALKWEPSRGGDLFPHLYGLLELGTVTWCTPIELGPDGRHVFPEEIA